jgi:drug/metabolite transporter (DMT)-like permease
MSIEAPMDLLPYMLTLGATLSFSSASLVFAKFSRSVSVLWMNTAKASVALALLCLTLPLLWAVNGSFALFTLGSGTWVPPSEITTYALLLSGVIGLGIGDLFLLDAFIRIGVSRTLMLYGFQPLLLGIGAALLFDQSFDLHRLVAIAFLIGCLLVFSIERYRETRSWEFRGLIMATIGVSMDTAGVLLTRFAFEKSPYTQPLEGHLVRCIGALLSYAVIAAFIHARRRARGSTERTPVIGLVTNFLRLDLKSRGLLLLGCFGGTYLSLCLYLTAIQIGHLASLAAIAITGPMFAALLESIIQRKRPSRYLVIAFGLFLCGFFVLLC